MTHAYAATKLLAHRAGLVVFDLVLGAATHSRRAERIVTKLASCTDVFFGGVLRAWARIDPAGDVAQAPGDDLRRLVAGRLRCERAAAASAATATLQPSVEFT